MKYNVSLVRATDNMCDLIYKNLEQFQQINLFFQYKSITFIINSITFIPIQSTNNC